MSARAATSSAPRPARPVWEDPRVVRGLELQGRRRRAALARGERLLGWKTGMGGEAVMRSLGTTGALTGYLTDATLLPGEASVDVSNWTSPVLEPEIAIRLGEDLPAGADRARAARAIDALAAAIEIADVDLPFEDPERLLAGNLFHRGVVLGPFDTGRAGADVTGISLSVLGRSRRYADDADPLASVGDLGDVACHVADVLGHTGEALRAGDVVITGSAIPALALDCGERIEVVYWGLGSVSLQTAPAGGSIGHAEGPGDAHT